MPRKSSALDTPSATPVLTLSAPLLVDIPTAAEMLSTTIWQVRSLHWSRKLRFSKLGKKFVIPVAKVREFAANFAA